MERKNRLNHAGVTLVEIIIVIAIIGILASTSVLLLGHLHYADTEKVVKTLDSSLNELQVKNMSKADASYLYVYHLGNGYYFKILSDDLSGFDGSKLDSSGTRLSNNTIEIYGQDSSGTRITIKNTTNIIKVSYTKSATFDTAATNVQKIVIDGTPKHSIDLVYDTGKHFMD